MFVVDLLRQIIDEGLVYGFPPLLLTDVLQGEASSSSLPFLGGSSRTLVLIEGDVFFFNRVGFQVSYQTCRRPAAITKTTARRSE